MGAIAVRAGEGNKTGNCMMDRTWLGLRSMMMPVHIRVTCIRWMRKAVRSPMPTIMCVRMLGKPWPFSSKLSHPRLVFQISEPWRRKDSRATTWEEVEQELNSDLPTLPAQQKVEQMWEEQPKRSPHKQLPQK